MRKDGPYHEEDWMRRGGSDLKFNGQRQRPLHTVSKRLRRAVLTERERTEVSTADAKEPESAERSLALGFGG